MSRHRFGIIGNATALEETLAWFGHVSNGEAEPSPTALGALPHIDFAKYSSRGGLGPWPNNSQQLAADVTTTFGEITVPVVIIAVPDDSGLLPHTWRFRSGGLRVGPRQWLRRYAVVPEGASLGVLAHELGHLLFGWPDLAPRSGLREDCLMALGGHLDPPTRPCAPLRVAAGWATPATASRHTTFGDLGDRVIRADGLLVEAGRHGSLLLYADDNDVELIARIDASTDRRVLAVVAELDRRPRLAVP